jgi:hypothetical protein
MSEDTFGNIVVLGGGALLFVAFLWVKSILRNLFRPRYITDERGERQRVITWHRGQPVYDPKTWQQRIYEEAILSRKRRLKIIGSFGILVPWVGVAIWLARYGALFPYIMIWGGIVGIAQLLVIGLPALFQEILYQMGHQGIQGAKVLDKQPAAPPGREQVETQKAHGDAQLASEAEALALLKPRR